MKNFQNETLNYISNANKVGGTWMHISSFSPGEKQSTLLNS